MSEQEKNKAGLHKEISSIFKGVPIPQTDGSQESSGTPAPERTDHTEHKPPAIEPERPETPKSHQVTQSLAKAEAVQEPKAEPTHTPKFMTTQVPKVEPVQQHKADIDDTDIKKNISRKGTNPTINSQTFWHRIEKKLFTPKPGVSATRQKAMVIMVPLLLIALIFVFRQVFGTTVRKTEASVEDNISSVATADLNTNIDWEIPALYPTTLRDPMQLGQVTTAQTETETRTSLKLIVRGILYAEDNASAAIGNQIVHEGEKIRGVTVVKISKDNVELEMNGKRWTQKVQR